jgi:hypothetical protein
MCVYDHALNEVAIENKYHCQGLMIYLVNSVVRVCSLKSIFDQDRIGWAEDMSMWPSEDCLHFKEWSVRVYNDVFWID